jgi:hypothetical protein
MGATTDNTHALLECVFELSLKDGAPVWVHQAIRRGLTSQCAETRELAIAAAGLLGIVWLDELQRYAQQEQTVWLANFAKLVIQDNVAKHP